MVSVYLSGTSLKEIVTLTNDYKLPYCTSSIALVLTVKQ